jgi:glycosyltransferase involved in cell wall biosynthesis
MALTILSVAYPLTPVGPNAAGGSEQVLTLIDRALVEAGHRSLVIAAEGSEAAGQLIASPKAGGTLDDGVRRRAQHAHGELIRQVLAEYHVDLVHMHSLDFPCYLPPGGVPVLATLHLPPDWYPLDLFRETRPNLYFNCVSRSQHDACPKGASLVPYIPNGIDTDLYAYTPDRGRYALALGRICPEKGFHFALDAAKLAGVDFVLAGEVFPYAAHEHYFRQEVCPRLDARRRFVGPAGFAQKRRLLAHAKCLLIPSTVAETSSLVAMEAMASGAPVIAFRSGALPEIVENGRTGFVVSGKYEMAEAIARVHTIDGEQCRRAAEARFSAKEMVKRYLGLYARIIAASGNRMRSERETVDRLPAAS